MRRNRPSKPNALRSNIGTRRSAGLAAKLCRALIRLLGTAATLAFVLPVPISSAADGLEELLRQTSWGEQSGQLLRRFTEEAKALPRAVDFGDSYADIVLTRRSLGGVPMVVFFQMDKATRGLKRIQLERIGHAVWLYFRFPLGLRMVEELLAARGIIVTHETVRQWARKFGQHFANQIRRRLPRVGDKWHLDEVVLKIAG